MKELLLFGLSVALGAAAWAYACRLYLWPRLRDRPLDAAATPILVLHLFRFVGAAFLIRGVAGDALPSAFAAPAAYGDLISVGLAWLALAVRGKRIFPLAVLVFNVFGSADLLFAFYQGVIGVAVDIPEFGSTFFIPTVYVPLLLCTHLMLFVLLCRERTAPRAI